MLSLLARIFKTVKRMFFQCIYSLDCRVNTQDELIIVYSPSSEKFKNLPSLCKVLQENGTKHKVIESTLTLANVHRLSRAKVLCIDQATELTSNLVLINTTEVIQIWHAGGAYKKFGYDASDGSVSDLKRIKRIHGNTKWVITSSMKLVDVYSRAFMLPRNRVLPLGLIRTDEYYTAKTHKSASSKIILYAPTFRTNRDNSRYVAGVELAVEILNTYLKPFGYLMAVRLHPSVRDNLQLENCYDWSDRPLLDCLSEAIVLITDYSSVFFDYSLFDGRIFWYIPDGKAYSVERGTYFDPLVEFPGYSSTNLKDLSFKIINNCESNTKDIKERFMDCCDGNSGARLLRHIKNIVGER